MHYVSTAEAAAALCISARSVRNLVAAGKLHAFRPCPEGRKLLLFADEVAAYALAARHAAQTAALANVRRIRRALAARRAP